MIIFIDIKIERKFSQLLHETSILCVDDWSSFFKKMNRNINYLTFADVFYPVCNYLSS